MVLIVVLRAALTVVSLVTCLESVPILEMRQEPPEVVAEEDQMAISEVMVRTQAHLSATDVMRLVTLLENVLMQQTMIEQAKATRDNDVMMEVPITEKVVSMTTMLLQAMLKLAGAVATTLVKAGTAMKMLLTCSKTTILQVAMTGVLYLRNQIRCHRMLGLLQLTTIPIRVTILVGTLEIAPQI